MPEKASLAMGGGWHGRILARRVCKQLMSPFLGKGRTGWADRWAGQGFPVLKETENRRIIGK